MREKNIKLNFDVMNQFLKRTSSSFQSCRVQKNEGFVYLLRDLCKYLFDDQRESLKQSDLNSGKNTAFDNLLLEYGISPLGQDFVPKSQFFLPIFFIFFWERDFKVLTTDRFN